jgi:uncharacterized protein (TIGR04255 family)
MDDPTVYPNAPLALVAVEARHPEVTEPLTAAQTRKLATKLKQWWPVNRPGQDLTVEFTNGVPSGQKITKYLRFFSRDYTSSVAIKDAAISLETTRYPGWQKFQETIRIVFQTRHEVSPLVGCERMGLRYINEIRAPDDAGWQRWINPSLLGPVVDDPIDLKLGDWQALCVYGPNDGSSLALRYGPREGYAVNPEAELRRVSTPPSGPFFLLDFDSFWQPPDELPEFQPSDLLDRCDRLHAPIRRLFEGLITDDLRKGVLMR